MLTQRKIVVHLALPVGVLLSIAQFAGAQTTHADSASAYKDNYAGVNHGTGFGPFTIAIPAAAKAGPPFSGTFVGDAGVSEGGRGIPASSTLNTGGVAFGFYANQGAAASITIRRNFTHPLTKAGDSFTRSQHRLPHRENNPLTFS